MAKVLSIIAPKEFQQIEYLESKRALEEAGHTVVTASTVKNPTDKLGHTHKTDQLLKDVKMQDYDAVLFVGGPGSHALFDNAECHRLAREFYEAGKFTTAICAAPAILGRAGLLKGKKATCWPEQVEDIERSGAKYVKNPVVKDGLIITADGPKSAYAFGQQIAKELEKRVRG